MRRITGAHAGRLGAVALLTGGLVLGAAACAAPRTVTVAASPSTTTAASDPAVTAECSVLSVARSITANAITDRQAHRLTAREYAAVLNTVAPTLLWRPDGLPASVQQDAEHLSDVVGPVTSGSTGPRFDPRSRAFLDAFAPLQDACEANGSDVGIMATSGG